jgi:prophage DNA circulation protein
MSGALIPPGFIQAGSAAAIDNSATSWSGSTWWLQLQPGSWRGVGFVMDAAEAKAGRRVAVHEYPYRDTVWPEDLGKLPRRFAFQAFLTGDDVYSQRDAMIAACEQSGPGTLVHPTMGTVQVVLLDFTVIDRRERGRYVEITFAFVLAGDISYPTTAISTGQNVADAATATRSISTGDLSTSLAGISPVPTAGTAAVPQFTGMATGAVDDPARILSSVKGLPGFYGRYASGSLMTVQPAGATPSSLLSATTSARSAVYAAGQALSDAVKGL